MSKAFASEQPTSLKLAKARSSQQKIGHDTVRHPRSVQEPTAPQHGSAQKGLPVSYFWRHFLGCTRCRTGRFSPAIGWRSGYPGRRPAVAPRPAEFQPPRDRRQTPSQRQGLPLIILPTAGRRAQRLSQREPMTAVLSSLSGPYHMTLQAWRCLSPSHFKSTLCLA